MRLLAELFSNFNFKNQENNKSAYIFYKIVDFLEETKEFALQCINTKAIFYEKILDIVLDTDILYSLHPIQACFVGIEYAIFQKNNPQTILKNAQLKKLNKPCINRYGKYSLKYQERGGKFC